MAENASASTLYIRCAGLHSRGELLNNFFFTHRSALGLQDYFEESGSLDVSVGTRDGDGAASSRLPADFPVEVVYVRQSRKRYFLVEWRYPTAEEVEKQKAVEDGASHNEEEDGESPRPKAAPPAASSVPQVSADVLAQLTQRTLALVKGESSSDGGLAWREQPVTISTALPGMTVAAERVKLELRDAQLKTQRVAEKRAREEAEGVRGGKHQQGSADKSAPSFVPRSVRRRE